MLAVELQSTQFVSQLRMTFHVSLTHEFTRLQVTNILYKHTHTHTSEGRCFNNHDECGEHEEGLMKLWRRRADVHVLIRFLGNPSSY